MAKKYPKKTKVPGKLTHKSYQKKTGVPGTLTPKAWPRSTMGVPGTETLKTYDSKTKGVPGKTHKGYRQKTGKNVEGFYTPEVGSLNTKYISKMANI